MTAQRCILSSELARALRVSSQQVYRWHNQSDMLLSGLTGICAVLAMDLDEFVYGCVAKARWMVILHRRSEVT